MQRKHAWSNVIILIVAAVLSAGLLVPVTAQSREVTLTVQPTFQGFVRPGTWLPLQIEIANSGVDRVVEIVAGVPSGPFHSMLVDLPGGSRKGVTVYAYVAGASRQLNVRLLSRGEELTSASVRLQPVSEGLLVGVIGEREPNLPAQLADGIRVTTTLLSLAEVPDEGLGLSPCDALILTDPGFNELTTAQRSALQAWVLRGGTLIINGDAGIKRALNLLPTELVPVTPGNVLPPLNDPPLTPLALQPRSDTSENSVYPLVLPMLTSSLPLAFGQQYGEGQVIVLAFDLWTPELSRWDGWRELWQTLLPPPAFVPANLGFGAKLFATFIEENLASALTSLPALDVPSINLIVLLLGGYLIVVGPVTYLVLRRLDRLALGWIVVPAVTVVFAVIAYGVGFNLRGGDVIVSQITLIDAFEPTLARERKVVGIFSPDSSVYQARALGNAPLVRPISVQGPWSTGQLANGRYLQAAPDGRVVENLEVPQWSLQAITFEHIAPAPGLEAQMMVNGEEVLAVVTNRGHYMLEDVALIYGNQFGVTDQLAPGEQRTVPMQSIPAGFEQASLGYIIYGPQFDQITRLGQVIPPELQLRSRILDALYGYGMGTRGAQPLVIGWYSDQQAQIDLIGRQATKQHLTLVRSMARLHVGGEVQLSGGFAATFEHVSGMNSPCFAGNLLGVVPDAQPTTLRFTLPRDLAGLQLQDLTLNIRSDMFWNAAIEVYDWASGRWESLLSEPLIQHLAVSLERPERFLNGNGAMRVRLQRRDQNQTFSCVYVDPAIRGRLP
ncbi:MAG: hypothetical protein K6356_05040 [Chloroflexus sp.]